MIEVCGPYGRIELYADHSSPELEDKSDDENNLRSDKDLMTLMM